jgi:hypothetical protein
MRGFIPSMNVFLRIYSDYPIDLPTRCVIQTDVAMFCPATGGYVTTPGVPHGVFSFSMVYMLS